jgi:Family of unknown function (DUF5719)
MSERREPGIPASSERGPSSPKVEQLGDAAQERKAGSRKVRRAPILVLLGAVVVAAIVFNNHESSKRATANVSEATAAGAAVPAAGALSTSWYCTEGTSTPDGRAAETIVVASISDVAVQANVTVFGASAAASVSRTIHLAPHEDKRLRVADIVQSAEPAVVVEVIGGQAVVSHEVAAQGDVATEPCARGASSDWYFANGTTLKGTQQYLVLFDPFGDDAIVDVTFLTDDGVQEPESLQGLSVMRRSRVSVAVHDAVPRQHHVAIQVHARTGRVVAERSQIFDGTASEGEVARKGVALSLGVDQASRDWYLPIGSTADGAKSTLGLANFGASSTTVEVNVLLDGQQSLSTQSVDVRARSVASVDLGANLPAGAHYAVTARASDAEGRGAPVVAELLEWWPVSSSGTGVASTMGSTALARRWVVPNVSGRVNGVVTALDPGGEPVTAGLLVLDAGASTGPPSAPERAIDARHIGVFDLTDVGAAGDHVLVVTSDRPVAVGLTYAGSDGAAASAAIPDYVDGAR